MDSPRTDILFCIKKRKTNMLVWHHSIKSSSAVPLAGPCHSVPLEAAYQLLNFVSEVFRGLLLTYKFCVRSLPRTFINIQMSEAPYKTIPWFAAWWKEHPDLCSTPCFFGFLGLHCLRVRTVRRKVIRKRSLCSSPVAEWLTLLAPLFMFQRL